MRNRNNNELDMTQDMIKAVPLFLLELLIFVLLFHFGKIPASAKEVDVPEVRQTTVMLTHQYYDDGMYMWDEFVELDGDITVQSYDINKGDYVSTWLPCNGNGSYYVEPYTIVDDGIVGDVYSAVIYTNGTPSEEDDVLCIVSYLGFVMPSNWE